MPPRKKATSRRHLATVKETTAALIEEKRMEAAMEARRLRRAGYDWWEIADKMRLTPRDVKEAWAYGIKAAAELVNDATKVEMLQQELDRLDALQRANWDEAMKGNVNSGKFVLDLIKERVQLLRLNEEKVAVGQTTVVVGGTTEQYLAALQQISEYAKTGEEDPDVVRGELA